MPNILRDLLTTLVAQQIPVRDIYMAVRIQPVLKAKRFIKSFIFQNFTPYHLSTFLSVIANISSHLTAHVTVQYCR